LATVTLPSVFSQFNPLSLEELGSDIGIQVFNQIIKSRPHDNIVVSPHGIASVLGMLQLGADGRTKKQLTTAMRYSVNGMCAVHPLAGPLPGAPHWGGGCSLLGLCLQPERQHIQDYMQSLLGLFG
jgi:hypothetical protein